MDIKYLKDRLTSKDIEKCMDQLGVEKIDSDDDNIIIYKTVCHCGDKYKLYFYKNTKNFYCYTECGSMDIISLVQKVLSLDIKSAINYICRTVGIANSTLEMKVGFGDEVTEDYLSIFKDYKSYYFNPQETDRIFNFIDTNILNNFHKFYHKSFIDDGISIATMQKFNIRYDLLEHRIIIPHYDEFGNLIAIRCRNLEDTLVSNGVKYAPIFYKNKLLSAPNAKYLFGLDKTKQAISKCKKVILVEAEKSVMQLDTMYGPNNISVALSSSNLSLYQVELLRELGIKEVIIALDKEFEIYGSKEEEVQAILLKKKLINKLLPYFTVSVIWDKENLLNKKDSPTDHGKQVFEKLIKTRILVG